MAAYNGEEHPPFQVIACGLPRTGTTTLGVALSILLHGPVFDGGAASWSGSAHVQRQLIRLASRCPVQTAQDRSFVLDCLAQLTEGCVASTDQPGAFFIGELLELYPDAKVICTVRDKESWWSSYTALWTGICALQPLSWLSPRLHRFCVFSFAFWKRVPQAVGIPPGPAWPLRHHAGLYEAHADYVDRAVPRKQLYYFNVRDGWDPLCAILGVPVPDLPFPHELSKAQLVRGKEVLLVKLKRRLIILIAFAGLLGGLLVHVYCKLVFR